MPYQAKTLRGQKPRRQSSHVSDEVQACSQRILPTREGSRRGTGNDTLIRHVMVSSDLAISYRVFRSQAIFPLNWVSDT